MEHPRVVDRLVIHGEAIDFRELCARAVPPETRFLVLDLDHTVHLGRNMGELLGWELCAYHAYGPEHLEQLQGRRTPGRFLLDPSKPASMLRYLALGVRMWAFPGLFYLFAGKLAWRHRATRRWSFRAFGPEGMLAVQRVPQTALMHQMAALPAEVLRTLAARVWERHVDDQVIERDDLEWLRARCPGIRIVLASASPQPTVDVAAAALGADAVVCSTLEEHAGYFSAPFQLSRLFLLGTTPRRLSPPSQVRISSGRAKVAALLARFPELADPKTSCVGMTDTGYGEDHCWVERFTRVVDVNSPSPFPPIVPASSPLREIHSAIVLTRRERARRAAGESAYLDPRRAQRAVPGHAFDAAELAGRLASLVEETERLTERAEEQERSLADARRILSEQADWMVDRIEALVTAFNAAPPAVRDLVLAELRRALHAQRSLRGRVLRLERPLSDAAFALTERLAAARAALVGESASSG